MTTICLISIIAGIILILINHYYSCRPKGRIKTKLFINHIKIEGEDIMVSMSYTQKVTVQLKPVDSHGNPAQIEPGSVNIINSNEEVCKVLRNPDDEKIFEILGSNDGTVGIAQIDISADADLGEGVTTISGFIGVEITAKEAVGLGFSIGEPVEQE